MNEIKYEAVFGDQSLFDNAIGDSVAAINHGDVVFCFNSYNAFLIEVMKCNDLPLSDIPEFAMRRIIPEPKRWTQADKDAGRLPEVGAKCRQGHKDEIVVAVTEKFVVTECQNMSVCTTRKDVFMRSYNPIESPEEKAQRLRSEWIDRSCYDLVYPTEKAKKLVGFIYDSLLSGELKAPGVE